MGLRLALVAGTLGCALVVTGIALIHPPSALIVAGLILVGTSYLVIDAFGADRR
jgi:hypothetical protein